MTNAIDMENFGSRLKMFRLQNHLTVEQVRCHLQLESVQAIYKWEKGKCLPQADRLLWLMQLYGINAEDLLPLKDYENSASIAAIRLSASRRIKYYFAYFNDVGKSA